MRRMKRIVAGAAAGACAAGVALSMGGCDLIDASPETVYGPPEMLGSEPFDASDEVVEVVYGPPPEFFDSSPVGSSDEIATPPGSMTGAFDDPEFGPDANANEDVYGPPEMFGEPAEDSEEF